MSTTLRVDWLKWWGRLAGATGLVIGLAGGATASTYSVNPTRVFLSASSRSALVTIKNESDQPLRFQLSVVAWSQDPSGAMQLGPTEDMIFFPSLVTIEKGEERKVRVAAATAAGTVEKTYRLFIEELPSTAAPDQPGSVQVLTRTGVPIFLQPARPQSGAVFDRLDLTAGRFTFVLRNTGTAHVLPLSVKVAATGDLGQPVFERDTNVWYVLAGGTRALDLEMPKPECEQVRVIEVSAQIDGKTLTERLATPRGACESK